MHSEALDESLNHVQQQVRQKLQATKSALPATETREQTQNSRKKYVN
jgi:hypothetical protein